VSKRKRKPRRRKRSLNQTILIILSTLLAGSMVISLFIVAIPGPALPTVTPWPTFTPWPTPTQVPVSTPRPSPTPEATEPPVGPVLPTDTPQGEATEPPAGPALPVETATITPTVTATPASAALEFTFSVCGDSRDSPSTYRKVLESVIAGESQFLIHTGDLVNSGTQAQWQEFEGIMADVNLPFYPVAGNHDDFGGSLEGYLAYSGAPAAHYSFDYGPIHFTLADSHDGGITADELAWLRDDLSSTDLPLKMVVLHHPPFDPDGTDHIMAFGNAGFMALMVEHQVDYVFAGHIHAYAREERDGVVYIITGGAGAPLYRTGHPEAYHHYLQVTIRGEEVEIEVIRI
jgi:predicted phosphodiesterase